jgi:hypothetical protein
VNKFDCKILDYCAQDNEHYHLIIDVNGSDLSKIMKSINIPYAMYAKCDGKLFKDRYQSRLLETEEDIIDTREMIAKQISSSVGFASFCVSEIIPCTETSSIDCDECISCVNEAYAKLTEIASAESLSVEEILKNKARRNQLIKDFRKASTLSLKSLGELFGGISESSVSKILSK